MPSAEHVNPRELKARELEPRQLKIDARTRSARARWIRVAAWGSVGLLAVLIVLSLAAVLWLHAVAKAALPQLDGEAHLAGLSAPVTVRRDVHGVPHIDAATQDDLLVAQGYVTAQDRLWQMDAYRRNANGELAEIMGPSLVKHDRAQRVLQFRKTAERLYGQMAPADRARLDEYARGVNLFIDQHRDALPPEFRLLHYAPKPWSGVDSLSVGMMMIETLDSRWDEKLGRERVARTLNNRRLEADLYPMGSWRDRPPTGEKIDLREPQPAPPPRSDDDDDDDRTQTKMMPQEDLRALRSTLGDARCTGCTPGSNNWVIAGQHTASGKPLLSNDMHLSLTAPNIWYMADLRAPGYHAAGVTLVGMPLVIAGHNEHVAWGFTALYADVQDLYVETLDGKGNYRATDGSWKPLAVDHEVIYVRGGKDVTVDVELTGHGPLLNPLFTREKRAIALKWSLYDDAFDSIPLYEMNTAANWTEFSAALEKWCWPTQNVVYADDQGHVAYQAVGRIPIRTDGLTGVPVSAGTHEWQGYIPFADLPSAVDPPSGFLATANSRVTTEKTKYPLSLEWAEPYRAERIYKLLEGRDGLKRQEMLSVQTDIYSEVDQELAHRFAYAIDHAAGMDSRMHQAADLMRSWDGRLTTDSAAASLVTKTRAVLRPMILAPKLGDATGSYEWAESDFALEEIVMHGEAAWLPPGYKSWDAALADAVWRAMTEGKAPADVSRWAYGNWHVVDIEHPLAEFLPLPGKVTGTGPQPLSGDTLTVKQVGRSFGPSQRFTMDWSDVDGSTENIVLGESGNPLSPYYRDQWSDYYAGRTFALPFSAAAVARATQHTLRLTP
ncbi:MAG: penicillin acylase family protein [Terracidiphilus sp.]